MGNWQGFKEATDELDLDGGFRLVVLLFDVDRQEVDSSDFEVHDFFVFVRSLNSVKTKQIALTSLDLIICCATASAPFLLPSSSDDKPLSTIKKSPI